MISTLCVTGALLLAFSFAGGCTAAGSSTVVGGPGTVAPDDGGAPPVDQGEGGPPSTGPIDYPSLFGPPASTNATPNSINGLWAGSTQQYIDARLVLSKSQFVVANRCGTDTVSGLTAAARISSTALSILESKTSAPPASSSGGGTKFGCSLDVKPTEVPSCMATTAAEAESEGLRSDTGCFFLSGTKLNFYGGLFLYGGKFTKLSD